MQTFHEWLDKNTDLNEGLRDWFGMGPKKVAFTWHDLEAARQEIRKAQPHLAPEQVDRLVRKKIGNAAYVAAMREAPSGTMGQPPEQPESEFEQRVKAAKGVEGLLKPGQQPFRKLGKGEIDPGR
jgi:hypothetical protein